MPADVLAAEGEQEYPQDGAVEQGTQDVDGLDERTQAVGEQSEVDGVDPPEDRGDLRGDEVVAFRGVLLEDPPVDVHHGHGGQGVELGRRGGHRGGQDRRQPFEKITHDAAPMPEAIRKNTRIRRPAIRSTKP